MSDRLENINVMLVDDHEVVRQGLKSLLEGFEGIQVVAEAGSGKEAIAKALAVRPDVVLMDVNMPEMDGIETTSILTTQCPECEVLALTVHEDRQFLVEMLAAGASGYVTKRSLADDVVRAIQAVSQKDAFLTPKFTRMLIDDFRELRKGNYSIFDSDDQNDRSEQLNVLSQREQQVVKLVAEGYRSAAVGEVLGITTRTVSRHRARIMEKLELGTTADLVRYAIKVGLVKP